MSRSVLGGFLKTSSKRFAEYTGYVHLGVYASVWLSIASLIYLISGCETVNIYLIFVLGGFLNLCLGILFWLLPELLVRYKRWRGKDWSGILTVLNIGIIRYVFFPCWSLIFLCLLFSTVFKIVAWSKTLPSEKSNYEFSSTHSYQNQSLPIISEKKTKTPEELAAEKILFKERKTAAVSGDVKAQTDLALMYDRGEGTDKDYQEAIKWYKLAANQGYARAQRNLAISYSKGEGVDQNYSQAIKWYKLAAAQGDASAQVNLGYSYSNGKGVTKNYKEAAKWYRLAVDLGDASAQYNLGLLYFEGKGIQQNHQEAAKLWALAAEQGDKDAQCNIGCMYDKGLGASKNYREAAKWFKLAAEQGNRPAQHNLANSYFKGLGVPKDLKEAIKWYKIAADQGDKDAKKMLQKLKKKASCEEIAEGIRNADVWKESHGC